MSQRPNDESGLFIDEAPPTVGEVLPPWTVMIADDDLDVHEATKLVLQHVRFRDRSIAFVDAYSAAETCRLLRERDDIAVVFLDVVMESDDAGLRAARQIREDGNRLVRIVLRTGHPGYAPERDVIVDYDIHDYREKTALNIDKLFSSLISALRAYDDMLRLEQHRRGLVAVLESVSWFDFRSLQRYLSRMLAELSTIADIDFDDLVLVVRSSKPLPDRCKDDPAPLLRLVDSIAGPPLSPDENRFIADAFATRDVRRGPHGSTFSAAVFGVDLVIFTRDQKAMAQADRALLELFLIKVAQALDNHGTFSTILNERDSLVRSFVMLGEQWGGHDAREVEAIQDLSRRTAARLQQRLDFPFEIDDWFVFSIATAVGFHDIGLRALPHRLFEKTGPLTDDERATLNGHVDAGAALLRQRMAALLDSRLFKMAETIVGQHHERHDGSGYPGGLAGEAIGLPARIAGVADTFVAMTSPRPYRPAHSRDAALAFIRDQRGVLFDPRVVDAFLDAVDESC
jgi:CheY-like chemotaxis protein